MQVMRKADFVKPGPEVSINLKAGMILKNQLYAFKNFKYSNIHHSQY